MKKEQYGEDLSGLVPEWERLGLDDTAKKTQSSCHSSRSTD